jgi:hypothetical protein
MKLFIIIMSMLSAPLFGQWDISNWQSIGGSTTPFGANCLELNQLQDTLLVGTMHGFRFYDIAGSTWHYRENQSLIGNFVSTIVMPGIRPGRVATGRANISFQGYLTVHDNMSLEEDTTYESSGGKFEAMAVDPKNPDIVYAVSTFLMDFTGDIVSWGELVKSTNAGASWSVPGDYLHDVMMDIAIHPTHPDTLFVAGNKEITRSTDGGLTWETLDFGTPDDLPCYTVAIHPHMPDTMIASTDVGSFMTYDGGLNWSHVDTNEVSKYAFYPNNGHENIIIAITFENEFLASFDYGATWSDYTAGFPGLGIVDVRISSYDDLIYVLSGFNGVYTRESIFVGIDDRDGSQATAFTLHPNYPNPFNPETVLPFTLNQAAGVELAIYNVLGQRVRSLYRGIYPAGSHQLRWDARDDNGNEVASGVYFLQLTVENQVALKKMVLQR